MNGIEGMICVHLPNRSFQELSGQYFWPMPSEALAGGGFGLGGKDADAVGQQDGILPPASGGF